MTSRPRILIVVHSALIGGAQLMTLAAAERLAQRYELHIMIPNGPLRTRFAAYGTTVRSSPRMPYGSKFSWRWGMQTLRSLLDAVRVAAYIRRHRISAVYVNTTVTLGPVIGAKLAAVPVVVHARELPQDRATQALFAAHAALADTIIPVSDAVDRNFRWCRRARFTRIHDGIKIPVQPAPAAAFHTPLRLLLVGTVGGGGRKGQDIAVAALAELVKAGVPAQLELLGAILDEASAAALRAQATALGVGASLVLAGPTDLVGQHMTDADILLSCAREEPLGLTIIEALALARPVIASAVGGVPEIVQRGRTGLLVPAEDARAVADAVLELLHDPARAQAMAERGRRDVAERFDVGRGLDALERELDALITAPAGGYANDMGASASGRGLSEIEVSG